MKLQYLAVIFIIIVLPIILVLNLYIGSQSDGLAKQVQYNTKLFESTLDGMKAFELNTVNNRFSQLSDSLKRDVDASINVFKSSLAQSMGYGGVDNNYLNANIPAVLFTLYDGYYIDAPTYIQRLQPVTIQVEAAYDSSHLEDITIYRDMTESEAAANNVKAQERESVLKPYIYYTMRYKKDTGTVKDVVVNYTLDNYLIVYGTINGKYVTRSGFLSVPNYININSNSINYNKLYAIFAKMFLEYVLNPTDYQNLHDDVNINKLNVDQAANEIINIYKSNSEITNTASGFWNKEQYATARVDLHNRLGDKIYEVMKKIPADESAFKNEFHNNADELLEALSDALIDEKFKVDRLRLMQKIGEQMLVNNTLTSASKTALNLGSSPSHADIITSINNANLQQLANAFSKADFSPFKEGGTLYSSLASIKEDFGEKIVESILNEKSIAKISDDELFNLIVNNEKFLNNAKAAHPTNQVSYTKALIIDGLGLDDDTCMDEIVDAFNVNYSFEYINSLNRKALSSVQIDDSDAKRYYIKSKKFSKWVNDNLGDITPNMAVGSNNQKVSEVIKEKNDTSTEVTVNLFADTTTNIFKTQSASARSC